MICMSSKCIETGAVFTKTEMNNKWNVNYRTSMNSTHLEKLAS